MVCLFGCLFLCSFLCLSVLVTQYLRVNFTYWQVRYGSRCNKETIGARWYKHCYSSNVNGLYLNGSHYFKALNNLASPYLSQLIVPYNPTRNLRPNVRLKSYGGRAFSVATPKHWNEIPLDIKLSQSLDVFKSRLKTYLFGVAFN